MSEKNILEEIAEKTRERIRKEKLQLPLEQLKALAEKAPQQPSFLEALKKTGMSYICEVKKASPSKGLIAADFPYLEIAKEYEAAGASAISCLTERCVCHGRKWVAIPILINWDSSIRNPNMLIPDIPSDISITEPSPTKT